MPRPVSPHVRYLPGLDGLRAVAVVAVLAYHLGVPGFEGGLLGVGMFFTLSGYLITMILLRSWSETGGLDLARFWRRRFRRLLPAVVLVLLAVVVATILVSPWDLATRLRESLAAMLYISNWTTIASDVSYFDRFAGPGPLDHLWSLAVEEQFYLVWPLVLLAMLRAFRGRLPQVAVATLVLAAGSFVLMAVLAEPGFDNTRAYEGTDTRAGGLLVGAAMAMVWRPELLTTRITATARLVVDLIGVASFAVVILVMVVIDPFSLSLYRGGILVLSLATAVLVAVVVHPASRLARVLGITPLVWVGARSYGIYLWHLPVITFTPDGLLADAPVLLGSLQVGVTLVLAALSWRLLEDPVRRHGIGILVPRWPRDGDVSPSWGSLPPVLRGSTVLVAIASLTLTTVGLLGGGLKQPAAADQLAGADDDLSAAVDANESAEPTPSGPADPEANAASPTGPASPTEGQSATTDPTPAPTPGQEAATPARTGGRRAAADCDSVVHVGDSTSTGLISTNYLPDADTRIDVRYRRVGVDDFTAEIDGAMSIVERYKDRPNAEDRVERQLADGHDGCWVFAMGTNEAANVAAGAGTGFEERIARVMDPIGDQHALWLTTKTMLDSSPYRDSEMQAWNEALVEACQRYPNMRVYDWRSEVRDDWFINDGIHFSTPGYVQRARRIAGALAVAFPADGPSPDTCLVDSGF